MFQDLSAHLQEDTIVHMQHMVLSLFTRVRDGQSVHNVSSHSRCVSKGHQELSYRVTVPYAACIQCILLKMSIYGSKQVEENNIL